LFEEPGTLAAAAILARDWFVDYLLAPEQPERPEQPEQPEKRKQ
jgi:putative phosphoribosyl transferase